MARDKPESNEDNEMKIEKGIEKSMEKETQIEDENLPDSDDSSQIEKEDDFSSGDEDEKKRSGPDLLKVSKRLILAGTAVMLLTLLFMATNLINTSSGEEHYRYPFVMEMVFVSIALMASGLVLYSMAQKKTQEPKA